MYKCAFLLKYKKKNYKLFKTFFFDKKKLIKTFIYKSIPYNLIKFNLFLKKIFFFFVNFINNNYNLGYNIIIIDYNTNYNYLPLLNKFLFSRSLQDLYKYIKFFNVNTVIFLDVNKKRFIFKKLLKFKLISISVNSDIRYNLDLDLNITSTPVTNYIFYLILIYLYLKNKKII